VGPNPADFSVQMGPKLAGRNTMGEPDKTSRPALVLTVECASLIDPTRRNPGR
jgi:hypothetical protein